jgi:hypothetical protein
MKRQEHELTTEKGDEVIFPTARIVTATFLITK